MKWNIILTSTFASLALAAPGVLQGPGDSDKSLEARDNPIWAANFTKTRNSVEAGFGRVQIQYYNRSGYPLPLNNSGPLIPIYDHDKLGRALKISLVMSSEKNIGPQMRWEAAPGAAKDCKAGDEYYFRFDFALDREYPVNTKTFNVINQIHQASDYGGSPPVEFGVYRGRLHVQGENSGIKTPEGKSMTYDQDLGPVEVETKYKVVYRVKFSPKPADSLLEVWVNDQQVLSLFEPPTATMDDTGKGSYWKGATAYAHFENVPLTVWQTNHRVGSTLASVNA
jgi:hypothetical protein